MTFDKFRGLFAQKNILKNQILIAEKAFVSVENTNSAGNLQSEFLEKCLL